MQNIPTIRHLQNKRKQECPFVAIFTGGQMLVRLQQEEDALQMLLAGSS
jgi:hypothetical protein